jgi:transaldolase
MIKVPATSAGLPAIEALIGDGINVNVTLLFSISRYEAVAESYLRGLERLQAEGKPLSHCTSVASFFISRIDSRVDQEIAAKLKTAEPSAVTQLENLLGETAIASARLAYQSWKHIFSGDRWQSLQALGAHPQRLLWASTSTKNPTYDDILYIEQLIGQESVTTVPPATLDAYRDHGSPRLTLEIDLPGAATHLEQLDKFDIDLKQVTATLLDDGLEQFDAAYSRLLDAIHQARTNPRPE